MRNAQATKKGRHVQLADHSLIGESQEKVLKNPLAKKVH
jgi:hypothetical protein